MKRLSKLWVIQKKGGRFMAECECLAGCLFFNDKMKEKPASGQIYKNRYCLGGQTDLCARHRIKIALGKENVPHELYPNQVEKVEMIIKDFANKKKADI